MKTAELKGAVDHALPVLHLTSPDGSLRAVLVNYACNRRISRPDVNVKYMVTGWKRKNNSDQGIRAMAGAIGYYRETYPVLKR